MLGANALNIISGKPYFKPYQLFEKEGIKIAVFGLVTPAIPNWLPPQLYSGIEFKDMVETARQWMPVILNEKPDLAINAGIAGSFNDRLNVGDVVMPVSDCFADAGIEDGEKRLSNHQNKPLCLFPQQEPCLL